MFSDGDANCLVYCECKRGVKEICILVFVAVAANLVMTLDFGDFKSKMWQIHL